MMALPVILIHSPLYLSSLHVSMFMFRCVCTMTVPDEKRAQRGDESRKQVKSKERGGEERGGERAQNGYSWKDALMQIGAQ